MLMTNTVKELAAALVEAQKEMPSILKDKIARGAKFSYSYVGLDSVMPEALKVLTKHGLSVAQPVGRSEDGGTVVTTMLMHTSGEYIADSQPLLLTSNDPQGQGSAITYARRYGLMSMIGLVADEDDDGQKASQSQPAQRPQQPNGSQRPAQPQPAEATDIGYLRNQAGKAFERLVKALGEDAVPLVEGLGGTVMENGNLDLGQLDPKAAQDIMNMAETKA